MEIYNEIQEYIPTLMYGMPIEDALNLILDELKRLKALEDELIVLKEKSK